MLRFSVGDVEVCKIQESLAPAVDPYEFLDSLPPDAIDRHKEWLEPLFYDGESKRLILSGHAWLIRTGTATILIEACAGNHKPRPKFPRGDMLDTPWLENLAAAGARPEDIDYVLCTHLHVDHVGWFTTKANSEWMPTFPNAKYVIDAVEYANWNPKTRQLPPLGINENCFEDSVAPVMAAGLMELVEAPFVVAEGVEIIPARGHTLGHVAIKLEHGGESALFVGDAMHTPLQIAYPDCATYACEDKQATVETHYRLLSDCADNGRLFVPTHFPEPYSALKIHRAGDRFIFSDKDGNIPAGLERAIGSR